MKKETLLFVVLALAAGILIGVIVTNSKKDATPAVPVANLAPAPMVNQQQMVTLEGIVAREPGNRNAWISLGHSYFDSDQPMKAIEAYSKALALNGNDPDVLTDQGVMYRRLGWFDKAISNFEKASQIDHNHQQSLYNLGIVYRYDLQDFAKAMTAWERFIAINPGSSGAEQVRRELEFLNKQRIPEPVQ